MLQIVGALTYASDGLIIAQVMGASAVALYAVSQRLFGIIGTVIGMAMMPLWPAYGEAAARGDRAWVTRTLRRSVLLSLGVATALSLPLGLFGDKVITVWVGPAAVPSSDLLLAFAVWKIVEAGATPISVYLNGVRRLMFQLGTSLSTAVVAVALKIALVHAIGVSGAVFATIVAFSLCSIVPLILFRKSLGIGA